MKSFPSLLLKKHGNNVLEVSLNRPKKLNAFSLDIWTSLRQCFAWINTQEGAWIRCVIITAQGKFFSAGVDLNIFSTMTGNETDIARKALGIYEVGKSWQQSMNAIEECNVPVIACVDGGCIGAGIEMIAACDIRLVSEKAWFAYKEVDVGMAADVGGLQRFPKIVSNDSFFREIVYSGRNVTAEEMVKLGFVSRVISSSTVFEEALKLATSIASKSPIATLGAKKMMNYARDHTVSEALEHTMVWNMAMLQSEDVMKATSASLSKTKPVFRDLKKKSKL